MCDDVKNVHRRRTYCCVFGCLNNSSIPELSLFRLPTEQERRLQWLRLIDREDLINKSQPKHVVCEDHFHPEDIIKNSARKLLKKNCLPSMNLPNLKKTDKHTQVEKTTSATSSCQTDIKTTDIAVWAGDSLLPSYYGATAARQVNEQEAQPGPSKVVDTRTPSDSSASREQDPLSRVIEQCRFCGEFSRECIAVSDNMPYLAGNKTTLALNDTSVQFDFNDQSLPKTVCRDCDAKLQEFCDFVQVAKAAQSTLINVSEETRKDEEFEETEEESEEARPETEMLVIKTEYDSQEDSDDEKEGIVDSLTVGETVFLKESHKRKSDTDTAKPKKMKAKEKCEDRELIMDIKEEIVEKDANDEQGHSEVGDTGTEVKPSELELATSALVFEMTEGTCKYQEYRSDR